MNTLSDEVPTPTTVWRSIGTTPQYLTFYEPGVKYPSTGQVWSGRLRMIELDGSEGEGGGQILRSALSLAICTQQAFRITHIRGNRDPPGLKRQHVTAVRAAAEICDGDATGVEVGSRELTFRPGRLRPGRYSLAIGTAGSCTLVLQTLLPPLLTAGEASVVRIMGGTHNKGAPPFEFLQRAFVPLLARMGAKIELELRSHGFYPRGGGEIVARVMPATRLTALELHERGEEVRAYAEAWLAALPLHIAQRELAIIGRRLNWPADQLIVRGLPNDVGPGNAVTITMEYANVTEVVTGFGERGVRAETVAANVASEARDYLVSQAPVGIHLADQLLLPMALGEGGSYSALAISDHLRSNALVIGRFTSRRVTVSRSDIGYRVSIN